MNGIELYSTELKRAAFPGECGVSARGISDFIDGLDSRGVYWHSLMFIRDGKVAFETHKAPYGRDIPHCMFSISKNMTCIALGFALEENRLSLDDRLLDFFPERRPEKRDEKLEKLKVRHIASMSAGKAPGYLLKKTDRDWLAHFFDAKWAAAPGEQFSYIDECRFVLASVRRKAVCMTLTEYLTPRLWEPLGIKTPYWETDFYGTEAGGWGICLTPDDFAKVFLCVTQRGVFNGRQIIPARFLDSALLNQSVTKNDPGPCKKEGYGFSFWRRSDTVFCGEGMYGQIAAADEKNKLLIITTGSESNTGKIWNTFFELRDSLVTDRTAEPSPEEAALAEKVRGLSADDIAPSAIRSAIEKDITGRTFRTSFGKTGTLLGFPLSVIPPATVYMNKDRGGNITEVRLDFEKDCCVFTWTENGAENSVRCGMDGKYRSSDTYLCSSPYRFASYARWRDHRTLELHLRPLTAVGKRILRFDFSDMTDIKMIPSTDPPVDIILRDVTGILESVSENPAYRAGIHALIRKLISAAEPVHKLRGTNERTDRI